MRRIVAFASLLILPIVAAEIPGKNLSQAHHHVAVSRSGAGVRHGPATPPTVSHAAVPRSAVAARAPVSEPVLSDASTGRAAWLIELNRWRTLAGIPPAAESIGLSDGSRMHARYLVKMAPGDIAGFRRYDRAIGAGAHRESAGGQWYSSAGAQAAVGGVLEAGEIQSADVAWEGRDPAADIDQLLLAPFHRLSLLAPWVRRAGYGDFGEYPRRAAALALRGPIGDDSRTVEFPPAKSEITLSRMDGLEWPNPLSACTGYEAPVGLPITVQVGRRSLLRLWQVRDETTGAPVEACAFDEASYRNSDRVQERRGRELLAAYGAIIVIPRRPLDAAHHYRVHLATSAGDLEWTFAIAKPAPVEEAQK
jgi:hypothetical protein